MGWECMKVLPLLCKSTKKTTGNKSFFYSLLFFVSLFHAAACPVLCSGNGQYDKGSCVCYSGWKGPECDIPATQCIDPLCSGHGTCTDGNCVCSIGYKGQNCAEGESWCFCGFAIIKDVRVKTLGTWHCFIFCHVCWCISKVSVIGSEFEDIKCILWLEWCSCKICDSICQRIGLRSRKVTGYSC